VTIGWANAQSLFGLMVIVAVAWALSEDRRRFPWRLVIGASILQALIVLALFAIPGAHVVLEARLGFLFVRGGETLPLVGPTTYGGTHGYDPRRPEMRASFLMRGPRVKRGQALGLVRLLDVAPTIARVLGLDLGKVEGRALGEAFTPP
jgi:hypothetical protein